VTGITPWSNRQELVGSCVERSSLQYRAAKLAQWFCGMLLVYRFLPFTALNNDMQNQGRIAMQTRSVVRPRIILLLLMPLLLAACARAAKAPAIKAPAVLQGDFRTHDPSIIRQDSTYYVFSTGDERGLNHGTIQIRRSTSESVEPRVSPAHMSTATAWAWIAAAEQCCWKPRIALLGLAGKQSFLMMACTGW
jgi:hypothetical protein